MRLGTRMVRRAAIAIGVAATALCVAAPAAAQRGGDRESQMMERMLSNEAGLAENYSEVLKFAACAVDSNDGLVRGLLADAAAGEWVDYQRFGGRLGNCAPAASRPAALFVRAALSEKLLAIDGVPQDSVPLTQERLTAFVSSVAVTERARESGAFEMQIAAECRAAIATPLVAAVLATEPASPEQAAAVEALDAASAPCGEVERWTRIPATMKRIFLAEALYNWGRFVRGGAD